MFALVLSWLAGCSAPPTPSSDAATVPPAEGPDSRPPLPGWDTGLEQWGPQAGMPWDCGIDVLDLSEFSVEPPLPAAPDTCPPGVAAFLDGAAHPTLWDAVVFAQEGAVIEVCPGLHVPPLPAMPAGATLRGIAPDARSTVLSGELQGPVLQLQGPLTVERLTIRRGYSVQDGGGIFKRLETPLVIRDVIFEENVACSLGGGMIATDDLEMTRTTFVRNVAAHGGGLATGPGTNSLAGGGGPVAAPPDAVVRIRDSWFVGNQGKGAAASIGGFNSDVHIDRTRFDRNVTHGFGGTVMHGGTDRLRITDTVFSENTSGTGGALSLLSVITDEVFVQNVRFVRNVGESAAALVIGGAGDGGTYVFSKTDFVDNTNTDMSACVVDIDGGPFEPGADVTFIGPTFSDPDPLCIDYDNARVTVNGATW